MSELIEKSNQSLMTLMDLAESSQMPRAYEVLSGFIKTQAELNKDLANLAEQRIRLVRGSDQSPASVTNQLFVTTAQLQELLAQNR